MRASMLMLLCAALLAGACTNHRYFAPRENANGSGPGREPAAVYTLADAAGEVRVWSRGARWADLDGGGTLELHVGFELENTGKQLLALDAGTLRLADLQIDGRRVDALAPARVQGTGDAPPGASARVDAWFRPEGDAGPGDVDAFAVRFQVIAGGRVLITQSTPFTPYTREDRWRDDRWSYWGPGYWGPGYWGPAYWGVGFGFGWHAHCH